MARSKEKTKERIIDSLGAILARQGFKNVGINTIAREAGCDKVLIYRYFGGMEGLLKAFSEREEFLPEIESLESESGDDNLGNFEELSVSILTNFAHTFMNNPVMREIMIWELLERNELTDALAEEREKQGRSILRLFEGVPSKDFPAAASILSAGITYLALRGKTADVYNGIELNTPEGWEQIENGVKFIISAINTHITRPGTE